MKLYDTPLAPNPRRVRWLMAEKAITDIEIVQLNLMAGDQRQPDYLAKAGLPNVPALELDDGTTITESVAICRYLESLHPEPNLFGRDPVETAVIEMWSRRSEMLVANPLMLHVRNTHPALAALGPQDTVMAQHYRTAGEKGLQVLDQRLGESEWLAGARFTIADILAFVGLDFGRLIKFRASEELVHVARWSAAMRARPAAGG